VSQQKSAKEEKYHILDGILIPPSKRSTTPFSITFSIPCLTSAANSGGWPGRAVDVSYLHDREVGKGRGKKDLKAVDFEDAQAFSNTASIKERIQRVQKKRRREKKEERQWPSSIYIQPLALLDRSLRRSRTVGRRNSSFHSTGIIATSGNWE
jgi:hypothetical protein